jgi:hypothetical protein
MGISNITGSNSSSNLASSLLSKASDPMPTLFDLLAESDNSNTSTSDNLFDLLDISPQAQVAADNLSSNLSSSISSLFDQLDLGSVQSDVDKTLADVQSKLGKLFEEKGIDTSKAIKLRVDADGQVIVANDNPQKAQIEQLFKDDPSLRDEFVQFTAMSEFLAAAREAQAFQAAYAKDPTAAVSQYSYLFNSNNKGTLSLSILGDKYQALFERTGQEATVVSTSE